MSSDRSCAIFEESEASLVPHDEDLEPRATQEEAAAYKANHENQDSGFFFLPIIHDRSDLEKHFMEKLNAKRFFKNILKTSKNF